VTAWLVGIGGLVGAWAMFLWTMRRTRPMWCEQVGLDGVRYGHFLIRRGDGEAVCLGCGLTRSMMMKESDDNA